MKFRKILSSFMAAAMLVGSVPVVSNAAQSNEYVDPATRWVRANGRTSEFDANATVTTGIMYCPVCNINTKFTAYRVPEYTKTGETALNRSVLYSDGTCMDGVSKGNVDYGLPGVDAFYTGSHWTKTVCENCGTVNSSDGTGSYAFGKDVYVLNPCDHEFFLDFDHTTYTQYNSNYHTVSLKKGSYCQFCKGTKERAVESQEHHHMDETVDAQLGNQRFYVTGECEDCGYIESEYVAAKSVVESYYGKADGKAHTVTLSDLSEDGVITSIRYGTEANKCNKTSAPNYTEEGYYPVYYSIEYTYEDTSMTENGVSYVWLLSADDSNNVNTLNTTHTHDYRYLETIEPTCTELGYERWQCSICGGLEKKNYTPATGHDYDEVVIREADCQQGGLTLHICKKCGDHYTETTPVTDHHYTTNVVPATCVMNGYTEHICEDCGYKYITDLTPLAKHDYEQTVIEPTCKAKGYTIYTCKVCEDTYVSDYVDALGHDWDEGHHITASTCDSEGVIEYICKRCDETMLVAESAKGHTPGAAATCTEPQTCEVCGAILELPTGHHYHATVYDPTCTSMGYTVYTCPDCEDEYTSDYTDATGHRPSDWIIDVPATIEHDGSKHIECLNDGEILKTETIPRLTAQDNSDEDGRSTVGDYIVLVTDKDSKPVFNSEISIDTDDNIMIKLPYGRLISADDVTTITVIDSANKTGVKDLRIFISDSSDNAATGRTDDNGQLRVPNTGSSTGDSNGTVTDNKNTHVVIATDKNGELISNCEVTAGDNYSIDVKLPAGTAFDKDNRITVTVVNEYGEPIRSLRTQIIGDGDHIENGYTNVKGQITLPMSNTDITDDKGNAEVGEIKDDKIYDYIVTVYDEDGIISDALVTLVAEDNSVLVCLPDGKVIDYYNRTTVKVTKADGTPVEGWKVTVYNKDGSGIRTEVTDEEGIVIVPPLSEAPISKPTPTPDPSSEATPAPDLGDGAVVQNKSFKYRVYVWDNDGAITEFGLVKLHEDGSLSIELPDNKVLNPENRVNIRVLDENNGEPVKGINVSVTDIKGGEAADKTNSKGIAIVPATDGDFTDIDGNATVKDANGNIYNVNVANEKEGSIESAYVKVTDGKLYIILPDGKKFITTNQTTVTVTDADAKPVVSLSITVTDTDNQTATKATDSAGKITVPVKTSGGSSGGGSSSGGGGGSSSRGSSGSGGGSSVPTVSYNIIVTDKDGKTVTPTKSVKDGKITLTLPSGKTLEDGYYTIIVKDTKGNAQSGIDVTLKDKKNGEVQGKTDKNGSLVLPSTEHKAYVYGYETGKFLPEGNMTRSEAAAIFARNIAEHRGETIPSRKSSFKDVDSQLWYSGPIAYLEEYDVISGYSDGTFEPEEPITRAEFVAMCSRFYAKFNKIPSAKSNGFSDVRNDHWAYKYINEAAAMDWVAGYADGTFCPDNNIKRAEVVAIVNRMTGRSADRDYINNHMSEINPYSDLKDSVYWAFYDVLEASTDHSFVSSADGEIWVR